jgi:Outer membrane lipoprotein carrier protein LolA-like
MQLLPRPWCFERLTRRAGHAAFVRSVAQCCAICFALCFALGCALVAPRSAIAADTLDLPQLMQALGKVKAGEASFTEQRHVAMLGQALQSSGKLSFEAPDVFVRETLKPRPERIAINGNTLTLSQGNRTRTMALDSAPEAAVIVEAIRGTLTGNMEALERHFTTRVTGNPQLWFLELVPREARLRSQVTSVRVAGQQGVVREVLVSLPDGDRSVMSIDPMAVATAGTARPAPRPASGAP